MCDIRQCARCRHDYFYCGQYDEQDPGLCPHYTNPINNSTIFGHAFTFTGRIGRLEYMLTLVMAVLLYLFMLFAVGALLEVMKVSLSSEVELYLYSLGCMVPSVYLAIAAGVKRAHDSGVSSWYALTPLIPLFLLNLITVFFFVVGCVYLFKDAGQEGVNEHGSNPAQPYAEQLEFATD